MNTCVLEPTDPVWNQMLSGVSHDTYHRSEYLALEAKRTRSHAQALCLTDDSGEKAFFLPYLIRDCSEIGPELEPGEACDVVSPYGYPGYLFNKAATEDASFRQSAIEALIDYWKTQGICSAFLRLHPILNADTSELDVVDCSVTTSNTVSIDLSQSEEAIWKDINGKHRTTINRARRLGVTCRILDYMEFLPAFQEIYEDTMRRTSANSTYFFSNEYFLDLATLGDVHLMVAEFAGEIVAATLFLECDGTMQAHLGGTRSTHINVSPFCILLHEASLWAKSRGNRLLHLGGGLGGANDRLWAFKASFSSMRHEFAIVRIVVDEEMYQDLIERRAEAASTTSEALLASNYFPAYRFGLVQS